MWYLAVFFLTVCLQHVHILFTMFDYTLSAVSDERSSSRRQQCFFITILLTPARCQTRALFFIKTRRGRAPLRILPPISCAEHENAAAGFISFVVLFYSVPPADEPLGRLLN